MCRSVREAATSAAALNAGTTSTTCRSRSSLRKPGRTRLHHHHHHITRRRHNRKALLAFLLHSNWQQYKGMLHCSLECRKRHPYSMRHGHMILHHRPAQMLHSLAAGA